LGLRVALFEPVTTVFTGVVLTGFFGWIGGGTLAMRAAAQGFLHGSRDYLNPLWVHRQPPSKLERSA